MEKSVGLGIYKLSSIIKTPTDKETVKKKSRIPLGSGTIIIKSIANTKPTTPKSVISLIVLNFDLTCVNSFSSLLHLQAYNFQ